MESEHKGCGVGLASLSHTVGDDMLFRKALGTLVPRGNKVCWISWQKTTVNDIDGVTFHWASVRENTSMPNGYHIFISSQLIVACFLLTNLREKFWNLAFKGLNDFVFFFLMNVNQIGWLWEIIKHSYFAIEHTAL